MHIQQDYQFHGKKPGIYNIEMFIMLLLFKFHPLPEVLAILDVGNGNGNSLEIG